MRDTIELMMVTDGDKAVTEGPNSPLVDLRALREYIHVMRNPLARLRRNPVGDRVEAVVSDAYFGVGGKVPPGPVNSFKLAAQTTTNVDGNSTTLIPGLVTTKEKYKDAKTLFAAIQTRFSGNEATKTTQKTLLKQMYENFSAASTESLDSIFQSLEDLEYSCCRALRKIKPDLDTMSFDDLYNNFKIVEQEVKGNASSSSSLSSQNMAFVSSPSSTNEVNTAYGVSTANSQVSTASTQKIGRKITINRSDTAGYDKSKNKIAKQESRARERTVNVEETSTKAMVAIDGAGFDWSYMADDEVPTNMALMDFSDSELDNYRSQDKLIKLERVWDLLAIIAVPPPFRVICTHKSCFVLLWYKGVPTAEFDGYGLRLVRVLSQSPRPKAVHTARPNSAVANAIRTNQVNTVKASACWVWRPTKPNGSPQRRSKAMLTSGCQSYDREHVLSFRLQGIRNLMEDMLPLGEELEEEELLVKELLKLMCDKKNIVLFTDTACFVLSPDFKLPDESQVLLKVPRKNNMYSVDMKNIIPKESLTCLVAKATLDESMLWHRRLGHINFKTINKLVKDNLVRGLPAKRFENDQTYVACLKGKQHKASCKSKIQNSVTQPLFMLHMDLFAPTFVSSLMNKKYCLVVTDDYSRFTWVFFLASKDETSGILKNFITEIENLVDKKVKIIRCDNGTEFKNRVMNEFCEKKGIKREFSVARTPQQNGVAERRNRTLIEAARTMLADSKLPTTFWAEAVNTACYVQNRVIIVKPHNKTPYELFRGRTPALSFMRPFGCHVTILNTLDHLGKFDGKSDDGFFVGYSLTSKAFRVYNIRTRKVEENLHIRFLENKPIVTGDGPKWLFDIDSLTKSMNYVPVVAGTNSNDFAGSEESNGAGHTSKETEFSQDYIVMPLWKDGSMFDSSSKNSSDDEPQPSSNAEKKDDEGVSKASGFSDQEQPESSTLNINTVGPSINTASANFKTGSLNINIVSPIVVTIRSNCSQNVSDMFSLGGSATLEATHSDLFGDETEMDMSNLTTLYQVPTTPNTRIHKDHSLDHVIGDIQSGVQTRGMAKNRNEYGFISDVYEEKTHEDLHTCLFACFLSQEEPKRIAKALSDPAWVEAMQEELLQFKLQKVWILVDLPKGKRAIGTKWIFRNKKDERGIVTRNKARLVAQGYTQEEGIDYDKVFASVARIEAIRLFLAYASFMGFMVYQMDVKSAFLYGTIEEDVYVCQPPRFEDLEYPDKVYKVVKALYGLHQAPRT
ncbi:putative ribonuclease H-like domain-containing protein [Tanacetum coccineum]